MQDHPQHQRHWRMIHSQDDESQELIMRLLNCIQAATFEMETLCRLAGIKATRDIPTAAVECTFRPRLLINPDFVVKYCERDEHLFLLVMHELWHVLLAHTQLYPRATLPHNIAFDAIINAGLARQFHRPEYRGFFDVLNRGDQFPGCLLRPPEGWPYNPQYPDLDDPPGLHEILKRLYPPLPFGRWSPPLYEDILNILRKWINEKIARGEVVATPVLLGDHSDESSDGRALSDDLMGDVLRRVVEKWPPAPFAMNGRGGGAGMTDWVSGVGNPAEEARRNFANILQRVLTPRYGSNQTRGRTPIPGVTGMGVMPNPRDRLHPARERLNIQGLLWYQPGTIRARVQAPKARANIYLDVSGSMNHLLPHLLGMLAPYVRRGDAVVFQFSTQVEQVTFEQLKNGKIRTTQGTDIACVMKHLLDAAPVVRRALILTDGYTGVPHPEAVRQMREKKIAIHVVLPSGNTNKTDLQGIAKSMSILPPHAPRSGWST
jgi:hypothetical protein